MLSYIDGRSGWFTNLKLREEEKAVCELKWWAEHTFDALFPATTMLC